MIKRILLSILFSVLSDFRVLPQNNWEGINQAEEYFIEANLISEKDNGYLWGMKLYGPMLFVNPENRMIVANQQDKEGHLERSGNVYTGELPKEENIANTAFDWLGYKWTMIIWPLPEDKFNRANLMMHELFHRIQDTLGFPAQNPSNNHLDEKEGRILLQLELQALKQALTKSGEQQLVDIKNALLFRNYRREIYPDAFKSETALELNEGLAEYTGVKLSGRDEMETVSFLKQKIEEVKNLPTLVRSFAYITGPIYGILLDQTNIDWRKSLTKKDDLANLLANIYKIEIPRDFVDTVKSLSGVYNGDKIRKQEDERERERHKVIESYRKKFIEDPILIIPLKKMNVQFDPRNLQPKSSIQRILY